ncbi:MAG: hypothetical protein EA380_00680 [Phycisphaeraceae bacterium]|nr:MAG: hypothetical protein EA380_00680 [Phycisphaeraceae bacterium]
MRAGQIIARLDDRPVLASIATVQMRIAQSRQELASMAESIAQSRRDHQRGDAIDFIEMHLELQRQRLDSLDRRAIVESDKIELQRLTEEYEQFVELVDLNAETDFALRMAQLRLETLARQIQEKEQALEKVNRQIQSSEQ